jgi:hypothetical protein
LKKVQQTDAMILTQIWDFSGDCQVSGGNKKSCRPLKVTCCPVALDRVLFFSYDPATLIIVPGKIDAWRMSPVPDPDFTQTPAPTDQADKGCEVRQSMSTVKRLHRGKKRFKVCGQISRAPRNPIFKVRTF